MALLHHCMVNASYDKLWDFHTDVSSKSVIVRTTESL